jgi:3-dehydroquinate dehydratase-2
VAAKPEALRIGVLHGPNLNLLGRRQPELYGQQTLAEIDRRIAERASHIGVSVESFQSNVEGELVDWIQDSGSELNGLLVNAAAYTHTSIAIRDALLAIERPFVEVHLSNIFTRESFRLHSLLADVAVGLVAGFASDSYVLALEGLVAYLRRG